MSVRRFVWPLFVAGALAALTGWACTWRRGPRPPEIPSMRDAGVVAALNESRQAVLLEPSSGVRWGQLGKVFCANDFREAALACFRRAEELEPANWQWPYFQAYLLQQRAPDAALEKLRVAAHLSPGNLSVLARLAGAALECGLLDEAENSYQAALELEPLSDRIRLGLARVAYRRGESGLALEYLNSLAARARRWQSVVRLRAEILQGLGRSQEAQRLSERANRLPNDLADPLASEPAIRELLVQYTAGLKGFGVRADILAGRGNLDGALAVLDEAAQRYPDQYEIPLARAGVYASRARQQLDLVARKNDLTASLVAARHAQQLAPANTIVLFYLGYLHLQRTDLFPEELGEAVRCLREVLARQTDHVQARSSLGMALRKQGRYADALPHLLAVVRRVPDDAVVLAELGDAFAGLGWWLPASGFYAEARQLGLHDTNVALKLLLAGWRSSQAAH